MAFMGFLKVYYSACRFESWFSWIFSFALGSIIFTLPPFERFIPIFFAFAFATASIFVVNQYFDREADKKNEAKRSLPIASEIMTPSSSLVFSFLLGASCLILVLLTDFHLLPYFIIYLGLWISYSAPIPKFKNIPVLDFTVSGLGAGFLPFYIGLGTARRPDLDLLFIFLITAPLVLFQSGGHIIQAIGDYQADRDFGLKTFAVKYGPKRATTVAGLLFCLTFISPLIYLYLNLLQPIYLLLVGILLPLFLPVIRRFIHLYKNPSENNVLALKRTARNVGIFVLIILWIYVLMIKML